MKREQLLKYLLGTLLGSCLAFGTSYKVLDFELIESLWVTALVGIAGYVVSENNDLKEQRKRNWDYLKLERAWRDKDTDEIIKESKMMNSLIIDLVEMTEELQRERELLSEERMRLGLEPLPIEV